MAHLKLLRRRERGDGHDEVLEFENGAWKVVAITGAGDWLTPTEKAAGLSNTDVLIKAMQVDPELRLLLTYADSADPQRRLWAADQVEMRRLARLATSSDVVSGFAAEQRLIKMQRGSRL